MNVVTLAYMCSLFGFMKEWLQEGGISTDNTMIYDNNIIAQKERWMFSDADCDAYAWFTKYYSECVGQSMAFVTGPKRLHGFTRCITTHFMTEMGDTRSCSDDSVRPDADTNDRNTMTLLSKDRLFYTFMVHTLDAVNTCQARNDAVKFDPYNCVRYIRLVKKYHAGGRCIYNTPSTDTDTELHYDYCLDYRLMKSLGADNVCANKMTLAYMCSLFGFMKEWLREGDISTDSAMILDNDTVVQEERWMFSDAECDTYSLLTNRYSKCADYSMDYETNPGWLAGFTRCITTHFITEMGDKRNCSDNSVRPDSDTNDRNPMTLLSKDRLFYTFMVDTLDAGNTCQVRNDIVTFSPDNCDRYITFMRKYHAGGRCTYNTPSTDTDTELSYYHCLEYRLMKSLGADSVCANRRTLAYMCSLFGFMKELLLEAGISTDSTMILDNDTVVEKERWVFSDAECDAYSWLTEDYGECADYSMDFVTHPQLLVGFTDCITTHFITEIGDTRNCSDDSIRLDSDTNDRNTVTLLSKDRLFYTFMVDTLDAGNTCQARNDAVSFSPGNCDWYITLVRKYHAGSRCTYDTPSTDTDTELRYDYCLGYRLMKSLGAGSICEDWTLISMCSLFGAMQELLQEADISTDSTIIRENDTIAQKERWMFSDDECDIYSLLTKRYSECAGHSMDYVTVPKWLYRFTGCITTHFMTEMGDKDSCSDNSVRSDSDTNDRNTITLLSKDRLFYTFMVHTLDAGNTCQTRNDAVTFPPNDCQWYITLVRTYHAGSRCTYNTPRTDTDTELRYDYCLDYRLMKSLGTDNVCADKMTLAYMCSLFGFMKEWLQEGGVSTDNTMILDNDTVVQKERWMFSDSECDTYSWLTEDYGECAGYSLDYVTSPWRLSGFTHCITTHFIVEMGVNNSCFDDSARPDSDTNDRNTVTLLSKDRLFYTFIEHTLDAGNTCQARNNAVTYSPGNCDWYITLVRTYHAGSRCTYNTPSADTDTEMPYYVCLDYRLMKSLGAGSICKDWTLISMCSLFGFMKELLQEADISTDSTMILYDDTITQKERWMFSDDECDTYSSLTERYSECASHSMDYVTDPKRLYHFTGCITTHFMTEMGDTDSCSDDSVRPDSDTNDRNTITLLSKDRLFYTFMADALDAGNTCQTRNHAVTFDPYHCDRYTQLMRKYRAGSRCTYNTPSTDTDTELYYDYCLDYRLMKSLGADNVCANKVTLAYMCSLFGFMKEWLQEGGVSTDNTMILDNDTVVQKDRWMFSDSECDTYSWLTEDYGECAGYSLDYVTSPWRLSGFTHCITTHFIAEMGVKDSCFDDSARPDSDTNDRNTVTLLSKDRLFYTFIEHTLDAGNTCQARNNAVTYSPGNCDWYITLVRTYHAGSRCTYNTPRTDTDTELRYDYCLDYRLMKSLGADSVCANKMTLAYMCSLFGFMKEWSQKGYISTDSAMILDDDTIAQKERWMFSDDECDTYSSLTERYSECASHSMDYETDPKRLYHFTRCITTHFMTEMGDTDSCSYDCVRLDSDTNDRNTITLLSKDRLFYTFMVDTLDAVNTCQARNDAVTFDPDNCNQYTKLVRTYRAGSRCTYNTPSTDTDTELRYDYCLDYRWMKSLGADNVCANKMTLAYMCSLFGFMKEWLREGDISTDSAMILDNDSVVQKEGWMFSDYECDAYSSLTEHDSECVSSSMVHVTDPKRLVGFTSCITTHFITEAGANNNCSDDPVRSDSDTNDKNTITLLSKDHLFYTFMVDTLNAGNTCQARNDAVTFDPYNCDRYTQLVRKYHAGSRCTYNTPGADTYTELPYYICLDYRLMKSLGAGSICKDWTLISMCSLFGFMKELLQEADISTDSAKIFDDDTIAQKERWMFSDDECDTYSSLTERYSECASHSMDYVTDPKRLYHFIGCITTHFMTEMGDTDSCSDDFFSVRPDSDTNNKNTFTLLSKDRLFYTFMVDTLDAGNTCQARNHAVTFDPYHCDRYTRFVRTYHAGSRCTYNTPSTDSDTELRYDYCLEYRLMKSLGAGSICKDWTLISMCSLFGFMKELLQEADISTDSTMILDDDTIAQKERWMLSDDKCDTYSSLTERYSKCASHSMDYVTHPRLLFDFTGCIATHFMTEMGDTDSCSNNSVRPDSDTNDRNTITLLSKDRLFYTFMVDTLDAGNTCQARNDAVTFDPYNCNLYTQLVRTYHAGSRCTYNTPSTDTDTELYYNYCLDYRLMKSLGADNVCANKVTLAYMCSLFGFMKEWLQEGGVSTDNTMILDNDTIVQKKRWMFSDDDCGNYSSYAKRECVGDSMVYETDPKHLSGFFHCMATHFMIEVGARSSCSDDSVRPDSDTNDKNTMTLWSKDRLFYTVMDDTLDAGNTCQARNDTVTFSAANCDQYMALLRKYHAGSRCTYNTPSTDSDIELDYHYCLHYRLMKSLGADSVCANRRTLAYMCSLFGFMKEWLQEGGVSTDSTMILDTDTIVQKKRWMFSDVDCGYYSSYAKRECVGDSMVYETDPKHLSGFIHCMTSHFMTEMGDTDSCSNNSVRPDSDTNYKNTMTLLSKDRLFYTFMEDTLDAGDTCQARNDAVTFDPDNCDWYIDNVRKYHAGSRCTYNTPSTDTDTELGYHYCLGYRWMKSLGVHNVCANRTTLAYMCSLFGLMREWLQEGGISTDNTIILDNDTIVQKKRWVFSDYDCGYYSSYAKRECVSHSMVYETDSDDLSGFIHCMTSHFMTDVGARSSCSDDSVRPDSDTNDKNTMTLWSKDRVFFTFMEDTLDAGNICPVADDNVTFNADNCTWYYSRIKYHYAESKCAARTNGSEELSFRTYAMCLQYRLMKSLKAETVCKVSLFKSCLVYYDIVQSLIPTCICVTGLTGNLLSLWMFCSGAVNIPTAYQLQWLEGVDITFIVTWWIVFVLPDTLYYFNAYSDYYRDWIQPVLFVCLRPLSYVARSCSVWLTVLIGLYRYLAICYPSNNLTFHVTRHGHKYVVLVVILSFLYNIPYFGEYYLQQEGFGYAYNRTGFVSKELLNVIYPSRVHSVIVIGIPCLILLFVTVSILVELRNKDNKKRNMQTATQTTQKSTVSIPCLTCALTVSILKKKNMQTTQSSVTPMFLTILITFILCQLPYFVWYCFGDVRELTCLLFTQIVVASCFTYAGLSTLVFS